MMSKKYQFFLIIFVFVISWLSFFCTSSFFAQSEVVFWKDNIPNSINSLTEVNGVCYISTPEELAYWSKNYNRLQNKNLVLCNDIDMSKINDKNAYFTPINTFKGTFDGHGHTISGLNIYSEDVYAGFFGKLYSAKIKNLKLKNISIINVAQNATTNSVYIGMVAGYARYNVDSFNVENCIVDNSENNNPIQFSLNETNFKTLRFGSIVGGCEDQSNTSFISNCFVYGNYVFSTLNKDLRNAYWGGIVGEAKDIQIKLCYSNVDITATNNIIISKGGGIAGSVSGSSTIEESCNIGSICVGNETVTNESYCGGIIGCDSTSSLVIQYCYNIGNISAYGNGSACEMLEAFEDPFESESCTVGVVNFTKGSYQGGIKREKVYVGGIAGNLNDANIITNCYNKGVITSNANKIIYDNITANCHSFGFLIGTLNSSPYIAGKIENTLVGNEGQFNNCNNNYNFYSLNYDSVYNYEVNNNFKDLCYYDGAIDAQGLKLGYWVRMYTDEYGQLDCDICGKLSCGHYPKYYEGYKVYIHYADAGFDIVGTFLDYKRTYKDFTFCLLEPTSNNITDIVDVCDRFEIKANVNNGDPILKNMGWESSIIEPENQITYEFTYSGQEATLKKSTITGSVIDVTIPHEVIENGTIYKVTKLDKNSFYGRKLTNITLPSNIETIGNAAFMLSTIQTITLPSTLSQIGNSAFKNCKNLITIRFNGSSSQWNSIKKSSANIPKGVKVICYDKTLII